MKPDTAYFWRVDEAQADGRVVTGRVARFETSGLVAWWKLDETKGTKAEDATGHQFTGNVVGKANWAPEPGPDRRGDGVRRHRPPSSIAAGRRSSTSGTA